MHVIKESGCSWWTGQVINKNAKVTVRSDGDKVVKVPMASYKVVPSITLPISNEYAFVDKIKRPKCHTTMFAYKCETAAGVAVRVVSKEVQHRDRGQGLVCVRGWAIAYRLAQRAEGHHAQALGHVQEPNHDRRSDQPQHDVLGQQAVVDVRDISLYKGKFMAKFDGVTVCVLRYTFDNVVMYTDQMPNVISIESVKPYMPLFEITTTPEVIVVEMLTDGSPVYIDKLVVD